MNQRERQLARIFRALSNPNRLRIYKTVLRHEATRVDVGCGCRLTDILKKLRVGAPTASHHVKELVDAELIETERQGKFLVCRANPSTAALARTLFAEAAPNG